MGKNKKTVLFLCECGTNISNFIDLENIAQWAQHGGLIYRVQIHNLLCSPDGREIFERFLKKEKPERIVIAACSPKMHEKTFQDLAEKAGVNMSCVQIANVREQCAWVTPEKDAATEKAKALIRAAVKRSWMAEKLEKRTMQVNSDLLIIGGGIAGIEAALTAARAGRGVAIVEREISLGGAVIKTEDIAPSMECAPCLLAPRLDAVRRDPNITVITNARVTQVLGFYGNFTATIHKKARFVEESCIGCEACFEACPVEVPSDFHLGLAPRKSIFTLFPGSVPAAAAIDTQSCKHFLDGSCDACRQACPFGAINFQQQDEEIEISAGALVIATGFEPAVPSVIESLGYGKFENVYTLPEFERMASSNCPNGTTITLKNGKKSESFAVIHCAGSLRDDGIPYCSGICCTEAAKVGDLLRRQNPEAKVYNIHNDLVFPGTQNHGFYKKQLEAGTEFFKCPDLTSMRVSEQNGGILLEARGLDPLAVDMVVLATGLCPASGTEDLAGILNVELDKDGFFKPDHELLHATGTSVDGIYVAGCAAGPCNVADAVTRSRAVVGDVLSKLIPGRETELEIMTAHIDEEKCSGCKLCIPTCPYKAIIYDADEKVSRVNEAICRGCGTCAAGCPSGAAAARHFTDRQIFEEIKGIVNG
ncbi:4Fe-4S binding protein [Thermodesulfobacteriota bacterium]